MEALLVIGLAVLWLGALLGIIWAVPALLVVVLSRAVDGPANPDRSARGRAGSGS